MDQGLEGLVKLAQGLEILVAALYRVVDFRAVAGDQQLGLPVAEVQGLGIDAGSGPDAGLPDIGNLGQGLLQPVKTIQADHPDQGDQNLHGDKGEHQLAGNAHGF